MNFDEFLKEKEKIEKLSIEEQKKFYEQLLKDKHDKTELYVYASFYYGHLFYQNGNFGKVIEIMEPIVYCRFERCYCFCSCRYGC